MGETTGPTPPTGKTDHPLIRCAVLALPFVLALLYGLWSYHSSDSHYRELEARGVESRATIISKRIIRSGTDRPRYSYVMTVGFTVGDKMRRGRVPVTRSYYDSHDPPQRVPIRYLPDDPDTRMIDPAMREKSMRGALTIIGILLFVGVANIFMASDATRSRPTPTRTREQGS
ncbi:DUF3592 domain-containing protein [Marinovum sp.]|uniref:DUF3592 domain-containing protein n=1 Tax=Marinovum sp. TaxID=2024839 RepID=UPI003A92828B